MSIDLRLLRHARALAEHGSFRRAAEALKIAQPSLSRGIKELEAQVGLPLFVRSRAGHEPTDFGRVFLQQAIALLAGADELEREIELAKGLTGDEITVGMGAYAAEALAPGCAARFAKSHPGVRLRITMNDPAVIFRALRARSIDLAIGEQSVVAGADDLEAIATLAPIQGHVVVRSGHPLAAKAVVTLADVLESPYAQVVMLPPRVLKPVLAARRTAPGGDAGRHLPFPAIECPSPQLALKIAAESDAFTFATLGMARNALEAGRLVPVFQVPWLRVEWGVVRLRNRHMTPALKAFVATVQQVHRELLREDMALAKRWLRA